MWAYNACGNSAYSTLTQSTSACPCHTIGENFGGGVVFYVDGTCQHGLVAATSNQSLSAQWGCNGTTVGASGTALGTGMANTTAILNGCSTSGIAARLCVNYNGGGFTDWYLPSKDELNTMYLNRSVIPGLGSSFIWSSSEFNSGNVWGQEFGGGNVSNGYGKTENHVVRAIRTF